MIKDFESFSDLNESYRGVEIDASKNMPEISVSAEIDPGHEVHPTISVYFPPELFMYMDLEKIDVRNYDKISVATGEKIGGIVQELDTQLNYELQECLKKMQQKVKEAAEKIHNIPEITGKRYGL